VPGDQPQIKSFAELLEQARAFLRGFEALEGQVSAELADRVTELRVRHLGELEQRDRALAAAEARFQEERRNLAAERQELEARLEAQRTDLEGRMKTSQAAVEQARRDLDTVVAQLETFQAGQLEWAAERQRLTAEHDRLQAEQNAQEREIVKLKSQLTAALADLETYHGYQMQWAAEREEQLKAARDSQARFEELLAQSSQQNREAAARRQASVSEIQRLNQELAGALEALARNQDRDRKQERLAEDLRQSWQKEKTELEAQLKQAREGGGASVPSEVVHALRSQLNAITGFSELLAQESTNGITAEERLEFLRLIHESAKGLVDDLAGVFEAIDGKDTGGQPRAASRVLARKTPSVLVADPDPETWSRLEPLLTRAGYEVLVTGDTASAVEHALQAQPIVVLVDAAVPPKGALGLVQALKREARTRDIPIVLMSAEEQAGVASDLSQPVLRKPIDRQQLLQVLVRHDLVADNRRAHKMPGTVVLVDDDPRHVRLVRALFKPFAIKLLTAETGEEGVDLARQHPPDLFIVDLMLPKGDGFATIEALRQAPATARTPVLVYTARRLRKDDLARLDGRVEAVIYKGEFSRERLLELILKRGERRGQVSKPAAA
jgi:CheY-like chemotaxis protein